MWAGDVAEEWRTRGFVVLPRLLSTEDLTLALTELPAMFPTPEGFHDGVDERRARFVGDEFDGIDTFPFESLALGRVPLFATRSSRSPRRCSRRRTPACTPRRRGATTRVRRTTTRTCTATTSTRPSWRRPPTYRYQHLELFVFLVDVPEQLGPPHLVPYEHTAELPMNPNFYPRNGGNGDFISADDNAHLFISADDNAHLYAAEQSGARPQER